LRSDNVLKTKAKNKVKKILELESNDTDTDSTYSRSNRSSSDSPSSSSSSSDNSVKKIKRYISNSKRESGIYDKPSDEVVEKQYEYAGSKMSFEDLEFKFFLAGELEIISGNKISDKEKKGRIELLKTISYSYELYEWKGI
jgi:hypothetical protein